MPSPGLFLLLLLVAVSPVICFLHSYDGGAPFAGTPLQRATLAVAHYNPESTTSSVVGDTEHEQEDSSPGVSRRPLNPSPPTLHSRFPDGIMRVGTIFNLDYHQPAVVLAALGGNINRAPTTLKASTGGDTTTAIDFLRGVLGGGRGLRYT
ncbi:hypothetical protein CALCODRAFT_519435 [Calocera cornea HHB12733]|uniref:Uncharacterized protein n=1 Tax=Calocera cornea HHB12733 TaxID=1353952 RepID=A0A165E9W1_9BASI|nr:hypothetical protein CALCODRAFT_519435 [Calocera cornea HHB12733]